jgi:molybdate transport system substrate-binding protein
MPRFGGWKRMRNVGLLTIIMLVIPLMCSAAATNELVIAAASDLNFAFKELVAEYEKTTGDHVKLSLGSSGNFYSQIKNGAPFDLYFSADIGYPKKLEGAGLTVPGSLYRYAVGRIVVWTGTASALDVTKGLGVLQEPKIKKIAIANPKHAPYGRAAVAAMEHFKVYDQVKDRLILGENVSQAAQFIESGACEIGIVALSLALAPTMKARGTYWEIPAEAHPPLEQGAVILKSSSHQGAARQFLEFVKGTQGQEIMRRYGFTVPN